MSCFVAFLLLWNKGLVYRGQLIWITVESAVQMKYYFRLAPCMDILPSEQEYVTQKQILKQIRLFWSRSSQAGCQCKSPYIKPLNAWNLERLGSWVSGIIHQLMGWSQLKGWSPLPTSQHKTVVPHHVAAEWSHRCSLFSSLSRHPNHAAALFTSGLWEP